MGGGLLAGEGVRWRRLLLPRPGHEIKGRKNAPGRAPRAALESRIELWKIAVPAASTIA